MSLHTERQEVFQTYNPAFVRMVQAKRRAERAERTRKERLEQLAAEKAAAAAARLAALEAHLAAPEPTVLVHAKPSQLELQIRRLTGGGPTFLRVAARICRVFKVHPKEVFSKRRHREIVFVRQAICYWLARLTPFSLPQIGRFMGNDHTTVLASKDAYVEKRKAMGRYLRPAR